MQSQNAIPTIGNLSQGQFFQPLLGLYPKDNTGEVKKKLVLDAECLSLIRRIAEGLEGDEINYPYLLPLIISLKNNLQQKKIYTTYIWNKSFRLRNRLAIQECLKKNNFNNHGMAINNISKIVSKKEEVKLADYFQDQDLMPFLLWLQDKFFFSQVLKQDCYADSLQNIERFKTRSKVTIFDRFFRFAAAFNTGVGTSCTVFNYGPLVLISFLAFFHIVLPPIGIFLTTIAFGLIAVLFSAFLIKTMLRTYTDEDEKLENGVYKSEKEIYFLAEQEVNLRKHRYQFQHKNLRLISTLKDDYVPINGAYILTHADIIPEEDDTKKNKLNSMTWFRVTLSCIGTIGTIWGVPNMLYALFGFSFLVGTTLTTAGLVLVLSALVIGGLVAFQAYQYDKKTLKCQKELDNIKQKGIKKINKQIFDEEKAMHEAALEHENLKQQRINKIAKLDTKKQEQIKEEVDAISGTDLPIDLSIPFPKTFYENTQKGVKREVKRTQAVINDILISEQHSPVNLGFGVNSKSNLVVERVNTTKPVVVSPRSMMTRTSGVINTNFGVFPPSQNTEEILPQPAIVKYTPTNF